MESDYAQWLPVVLLAAVWPDCRLLSTLLQIPDQESWDSERRKSRVAILADKPSRAALAFR